LRVAEIARECYSLHTKYGSSEAVDVKKAFSDVVAALVVENIDACDGELRSNVCAATKKVLQSLASDDDLDDIIVVSEVFIFFFFFFFLFSFCYRKKMFLF
jgi:hypothetical protein